MVAKFTTGVVDTSGKFAADVIDTVIPVAVLLLVSLIPVVHLDLCREFSKKFEFVLLGYSGAGGKLINEKTSSKNTRDTVPLRGV
jgi:hypothetical protein